MSVVLIALIVLVILSILVSKISDYVDNKRNDETKQVNTQIHPVSTYDEHTPLLTMWISTCSTYIMANELNYLRSIGKFSKFDNNKAGDFVLEIITLILGFLKEYKIKTNDGWERLWLKNVSANFITSGAVNKENIKALFDERIKFYSDEIYFLKDSVAPLPNEIISQMYKPMIPGKLTHNIPVDNGFTLQENLIIWKIVVDEVGKLMNKISQHKDIMYLSKAESDALLNMNK